MEAVPGLRVAPGGKRRHGPGDVFVSSVQAVPRPPARGHEMGETRKRRGKAARRSKVPLSFTLRGCTASDIARESDLKLADEAEAFVNRVMAEKPTPDEVWLAERVSDGVKAARDAWKGDRKECVLPRPPLQEHLSALRELHRVELARRGLNQLAASRRGADAKHGSGAESLRRKAEEIYKRRLPAGGKLGDLDRAVGWECGRDDRWARGVRLRMGEGKFSRTPRKD